MCVACVVCFSLSLSQVVPVCLYIPLCRCLSVSTLTHQCLPSALVSSLVAACFISEPSALLPFRHGNPTSLVTPGHTHTIFTHFYPSSVNDPFLAILLPAFTNARCNGRKWPKKRPASSCTRLGSSSASRYRGMGLSSFLLFILSFSFSLSFSCL